MVVVRQMKSVSVNIVMIVSVVNVRKEEKTVLNLMNVSISSVSLVSVGHLNSSKNHRRDNQSKELVNSNVNLITLLPLNLKDC